MILYPQYYLPKSCQLSSLKNERSRRVAELNLCNSSSAYVLRYFRSSPEGLVLEFNLGSMGVDIRSEGRYDEGRPVLSKDITYR
jgi:hypothetical protein